MIREIKEEKKKELQPILDEELTKLTKEKERLEQEKKDIIKNIDELKSKFSDIEFLILKSLPKEDYLEWDKLYEKDKEVDIVKFLTNRGYIDTNEVNHINNKASSSIFGEVRYRSLFKKISELIDLLDKIISQKEKSLKTNEDNIENINKKIANVQSIIQPQIDEIESKKTLEELGFSLEEAITFLSERGIPIVLREEDKVITERHEVFDSFDKLVGIHKTGHIPKNGIIYTPSAGGKKQIYSKLKFRGEKITLNTEYIRDTIHICMNGEVTSNNGGNWDEAKYMVIIPMSEISKEKIISGLPADTQIEGSLTLPEGSWILCPDEKVEEVQSQNPKIKVLGYEGEALGYGNAFITTLGYEHRETGKWQWCENGMEAHDESYGELMEKHGIDEKPHRNSEIDNKDIQLRSISIIEEYLVYIANHYTITVGDISNIIKESGLKFEFENVLWTLDGSKISNEGFQKMLNNLEARGIIFTEDYKVKLNKIIEDSDNKKYVFEDDFEKLFETFIKGAVKSILIAQDRSLEAELVDEIVEEMEENPKLKV